MNERGYNGPIPLRQWIPAAAIFLGLASTTCAADSYLRAIHAITNEQAKAAQPVDFEATVVYWRGYENIMFVQDATPPSLCVLPTHRHSRREIA